MAGQAGRIACPRCGSNNFDTVTACWKCGTSLSGGPVMGTPPVPQSQPAQPAFASPAAQPYSAPPSYSSVADRVAYSPPVMAAAAVVTGSSSTANRAAFWLGILFPYFGIAFGLAFMMCDDRRRQEVGRICLIWSLVSTVAHIILFFLSAIGMREYFMLALNTMKAQAGRAGGAGGIGGLGGGAE